MLHIAQGFQGAAEEGDLPSTGGGKKVTPVMPDSKESGHEDGSPGRMSEVIRRILQHKKVGTDILVEGQKLFNKLEAKFSDANISAASFRQLVDKCAGIEMILVNEMLKEVGIELDDRLHMNKLISGALAEARDNEEREERERKVYASKIGIMVDHDDEHAEVEGKLERALAIRSFCHQVPFFNILYVFLFDGAPDDKKYLIRGVGLDRAGRKHFCLFDEAAPPDFDSDKESFFKNEYVEQYKAALHNVVRHQ